MAHTGPTPYFGGRTVPRGWSLDPIGEPLDETLSLVVDPDVLAQVRAQADDAAISQTTLTG